MKYLMIKANAWLLSSMLVLLMPIVAFAQEVEVGFDQLATLLLSVITNWQLLGWQAGVVALLTLIVSTTKNSVLRGYIWDKLGWAKAFVAPGLGIVLYMLGMAEFSWKAALLGLTSGLGAIALHQLLDAVKGIPSVGPIWVKVIDFLGTLLKRPPVVK